MSPTCMTRLTERSEFTDLTSKGALSRRFWLYGQSPNTAMVSGPSESRSSAMAGAAPARPAASSMVEMIVLFMGGRPRMKWFDVLRPQPTVRLSGDGRAPLEDSWHALQNDDPSPPRAALGLGSPVCKAPAPVLRLRT